MKIANVLAFVEFYANIKDEKISLPIAYKLNKLANDIEPGVRFYREKLAEIISKYGEKDENGNIIPTEGGEGIKLKQGYEPDCMKEMAELETLDIDVPDVKFNLEDFSNVNLTVSQMLGIMPFLNPTE